MRAPVTSAPDVAATRAPVPSAPDVTVTQARAGTLPPHEDTDLDLRGTAAAQPAQAKKKYYPNQLIDDGGEYTHLCPGESANIMFSMAIYSRCHRR